MSTLITGVPGTGKTAQVVYEITKLLENHPGALIYQHGIPELKIPHVQTFCESDACLTCKDTPKENKTIMAENWFDYVKPGDIVVIDECQRIWPTRGPSRPRPKSVSMMEVHRKYGVEMFFMTQHPSLIDSDMRKHFRRHIHLAVNWKGRKLYEWDQTSDALKTTTARERAFKLPSKIFDLYKSAEAHIELKRRKPASFYVALASFLFVLTFGTWFIYKHTTKPSTENQIVQNTEQPEQKPDIPSENSNPSSNLKESFPDFKPEIQGVPESAPAYRQLLQVKSAPTLAGCIKSQNSCKCYTKQATPYPLTYEQCLENINHLHFDPYAEPKNSVNIKHEAPNQQPPENSTDIAPEV